MTRMVVSKKKKRRKKLTTASVLVIFLMFIVTIIGIYGIVCILTAPSDQKENAQEAVLLETESENETETESETETETETDSETEEAPDGSSFIIRKIFYNSGRQSACYCFYRGK